jgi:serine/threonine protein kinase
MIHRDVKPANLWLEAGRGRVKIVDFGLARGADEDVRLTQTGIMIGTPAYMAPEQAEGENLDGRCDLFSLGCVLYRMTTGELPFKGKTAMAVVTALATKTPKPPRSLDASVPEALSGLIMRLLSKKPSGRPDSAHEVAEELGRIERALGSEGVPAAASKGEEDVGAAAAPAEEQDEAGDDAAEGEDEEATSPARRKGRRASGKRKRRKGGKGGDVNWERRVIVFGIWVAVGIALFIAYMIIRNFF